MSKHRLIGRIRYVEDWFGRGEHFVFETRWSDEDTWGLDVAYPIKDDKVSYEAIFKLCQWSDLGISFFRGEPELRKEG